MKIGAIIPKKVSKHNQGSVERTERHKGYLTLKPQQWDWEVDLVIKCKPPAARVGKSAGFEKTLYQLQGDEPPEKWILWKKDVHEKIVTKNPDWDLIFTLLFDLTNKAASSVIHDAFHALNISAGDYVKITFPDYSPFQNKKTQKKLLAAATNADELAMTNAKIKAAWTALVKKPAEINPLFMKEILFRLEELIFGTDMIGRNVYQLLQRLIRHYKVDPNQGIKGWQTRINQLNDYILHVPCDALENCNEPKVKYTEIDMRKILDFALPSNYSATLFNLDWNIY